MDKNNLDLLEKQLNRYTNFELNWDGYGGIPATEQTIALARKFFSLLVNVDTKIHLYPSTNGSVIFSFRLSEPADFLEIECGPDNQFKIEALTDRVEQIYSEPKEEDFSMAMNFVQQYIRLSYFLTGASA